MRSIPYVRVNPHLISRARQSGHLLRTLTTVAGFFSPQAFSRMLCSGVVPGTTTNVTRLRRLANSLGFPQDQVFVDEFVPAEPRRRKFDAFSEIPPAPGRVS